MQSRDISYTPFNEWLLTSCGLFKEEWKFTAQSLEKLHFVSVHLIRNKGDAMSQINMFKGKQIQILLLYMCTSCSSVSSGKAPLFVLFYTSYVTTYY